MVTKISFYILNNDSSPKGHALYTCRIVEKAYNNKHKIYIHTTSQEEAQNFDTQLWTFSDISFIPHEIYAQEVNQNSKILIGYNDPPSSHNDILINMTPEILPFYREFNHLIEVIPNDNELKALARDHFHLYKNGKHPIEVFNID